MAYTPRANKTQHAKDQRWRRAEKKCVLKLKALFNQISGIPGHISRLLKIQSRTEPHHLLLQRASESYDKGTEVASQTQNQYMGSVLLYPLSVKQI